MDVQIKVSISGPLFDGRAVRAVADYIDAAKKDVGQQGLANVHLLLDRSLRNPTGRYESAITVQAMGGDVVVHDRQVIYGWWLEGIGSRNYPKTRFRGYHSFERATGMLQHQARPLAERILPRYLERMR
ncbi:hypothetical protein Aph01nite_13150 [Acrocarpospora phusangensis]|uniref:Uncharacterized protein n=1 Tax=Acrocarpospora phusangensis TaxID=1070424 RepID=A0A919QAA5_9ACTN|nr:hypothetical protein [Acrocarpospora phusangensis]GIH23005.1 hypothetical protein Aph01nite_13150 [Acrocarpospora phusangensis]